MDKKFSIAVILAAQDRMSRVINEATKKSLRSLDEFQKKADRFSKKSFSMGRDAATLGVAAGAALAVPIKAFADLEDAGLRLKSTMMKDGGTIDKNFSAINKLALKLGDQLPGTTADFQRMFAAMISGGVPAESILGGIGEAAAHMAVVLNMSYESTASFASKLKTATGVADGEMNGLLDTLVKVSNVLPGADASEKATQLEEAFSRSGGQLKNFGLQGLQASKQVATLYAELIRGGAHGETVGTGFGKILESFYDKKKMANFNAMAQSMGLQFEFIDKKTGDFKGVENMVEQFDKLKNLKTIDRTNLITALVGDGQDSNFIKVFANLGVAGYNEMQKSIALQGTLDERTKIISGSLRNQWEAFTGTITNSMAKFAEKMQPTLESLLIKLNEFAVWLGKMIDTHPEMAKWIGLIVGGFAAIMTVVGSVAFTLGSFARTFGIVAKGFGMGIKIFNMLRFAIGFLIPIIETLTAALWANPILAIIGAVALAAYLIIRNWDMVKKYLMEFWNFFKQNKWAQLAAIIAMPLIGPVLVIIANWEKIKDFFGSIGEWFRTTWNKTILFFKTLPARFKEAGKNMMHSLWEGIKEFASKPINKIKEVAQKIRDFFPFSPAKTGPLRDIHKIRLIETIAQAIKPAPIVAAVRNVAAATMLATGGASGANGSGGGMHVTYAPVVHIGAGADAASIQQMFKKHERDILKLIDEANRKRDRTKF